ncbi:hypothetical protein ACU686_12560 [Yinghuangia aomiensis]
MDHVGLRRRRGAPSLPGPNQALGPGQTSRLAPHVEHEVFLASRAVSAWRLDVDRLQSAVEAFGDGIPILVYQQGVQ